jgi:hypothetical protein
VGAGHPDSEAPSPSASTKLDPEVLTRLVLARRLFTRGEEEAGAPSPLSAISILPLHDSVELFLHAAWLNRKMPGKAPADLMGYWEPLKPLSGQAELEGLARLRRDFKHGGIRVDSAQLKRYPEYVRDFFEVESPRLFGIPFRELSLAAIVQHDSVRAQLQEAIRLLEGGERDQALELVAIAFQVLTYDYHSRTQQRYGRSLANDFSEGLSPSFSVYGNDLDDLTRNVQKAVAAIANELRYLSLGLDYGRLRRFLAMTPTVVRTWSGSTGPFGDGDWKAYPRSGASPVVPEEVRACIDFVVESALHLQTLEERMGI